MWLFISKILLIVPGSSLDPPSSRKRSPSAANIQARSSYHSQPAQVYDKAWFCWFNHTLLDFFVYVDQDGSSNTASTGFAQATSTPTSASSTSSAPWVSNGITGPPISHPPNPASTWAPKSAGIKRSAHNGRSTTGYQNYPLLVKIEEKRVPTKENVAPYCELMQINQDMSITPVSGVNQINIRENEPPLPSGYSMKRDERIAEKRQSDQGDADGYESNCCCGWMSS